MQAKLAAHQKAAVDKLAMKPPPKCAQCTPLAGITVFNIASSSSDPATDSDFPPISTESPANLFSIYKVILLTIFKYHINNIYSLSCKIPMSPNHAKTKTSKTSSCSSKPITVGVSITASGCASAASTTGTIDNSSSATTYPTHDYMFEGCI